MKTVNSKRKVPIADNVVQILRTYKETQNNWKQRLGDVYEDLNLVICTETGTIQDPQNLLRVMKRICKQANVLLIRFHDIRHTHASILISKGIDLVKVSNRLGHSNAKITLEYYAHLLPNDDNEVADIFQNAIEESR